MADETARIPDPVATTVQTIAELRTRSERRVDARQRAIEAITALLGRPTFLYSSMGFVVTWIGINLILRAVGGVPFDVPPFYWLQGIVSLTALFTTTTVLISQRRQDSDAERREHLDLQISILVEQETTKIISLLEELRRDLPGVPNRRDPEAERLASVTDPKEIVSELERVMDEATVDVLIEASEDHAAHESDASDATAMAVPVGSERR